MFFDVSRFDLSAELNQKLDRLWRKWISSFQFEQAALTQGASAWEFPQPRVSYETLEELAESDPCYSADDYYWANVYWASNEANRLSYGICKLLSPNLSYDLTGIRGSERQLADWTLEFSVTISVVGGLRLKWIFDADLAEIGEDYDYVAASPVDYYPRTCLIKRDSDQRAWAWNAQDMQIQQS